MICGLCLQHKVSLRTHHVWPRAYGGEEGPTIDICVDCHDNCHQASSIPMVYDKYISSLPPQSRDAARQIIEFIRQARGSGITRTQKRVTITLDVDVYDTLTIAAKDRNISVHELIKNILKISVGGKI